MKPLCPLGVPQPGYGYVTLKLVTCYRCILARFKLPHFVIGPVQHRAQHKLIFFSSLAVFHSHFDLHSVRWVWHAIPWVANFKPGHISVLYGSQWDGYIPSMARIPSSCHSSCSNLSMRTESATTRALLWFIRNNEPCRAHILSDALLLYSCFLSYFLPTGSRPSALPGVVYSWSLWCTGSVLWDTQHSLGHDQILCLS